MEPREMLERMARLVHEIMEYGDLLTTEDRTEEWADWEWRCQKARTMQVVQTALRELVEEHTEVDILDGGKITNIIRLARDVLDITELEL